MDLPQHTIRTSTWVLLISLGIGVPLFVYVLVTTNLTEAGRLLDQLKLQHIALFALLGVMTPVVLTSVWQHYLRFCGINIPFTSAFNYRMVGFAVSFLTPGPRVGGEVTQGYLIAEQTDGNSESGVLASVMESFTAFLGGLVFDTAAVILALVFLPRVWWLQITLIGLVGAIFLVAVLWYIFIQNNLGHRILHWLLQKFSALPDTPNSKKTQVTDTLHSYMKDNWSKFMLYTMLVVAGKFLLVGQIMVLTDGLLSPVTIFQAILLAAAVDIAYSIPSYMGIGMLEAGQAGVLQLTGGADPASVVIATLLRVRDIILSMYGLLLLAYLTSPSENLRTFFDPPAVG